MVPRPLGALGLVGWAILGQGVSCSAGQGGFGNKQLQGWGGGESCLHPQGLGCASHPSSRSRADLHPGLEDFTAVKRGKRL